MSRPRSGPASHAGQPPLRAGTYCDGAEAAPALTRKTVVRIPSSPSAPSACTTRTGARKAAGLLASSCLLAAIRTDCRGGAAGMVLIVTSPTREHPVGPIR